MSRESGSVAVASVRRMHCLAAPSTTSKVRKGRFAPYWQALNALAERTRTPLPSLIFSFAVLHELTAIVPVVGLFFAARTLNVGERVLKSFPDKFTNEAKYHPSGDEASYRQKMEAKWWYEGRQMAERVGRRYGLFGFPKNGTERATTLSEAEQGSVLFKAGPDIVNFIFAYLTTKSLLPVRVGLSLYWSPAFSRRVVEPTRATIVRCFRRKSA
ncbi:hypothetical protein FOMPIDRAFT_1029285 [Fomitopsis schrenkii]|uniref:Uncharacterized protein n=1 Tax=Fomitopsis schrenkii TaxID=2126942 RepID=S8EGS8_FOMSC|nr:hypothetical protein FOMPIDRAFT_1029285 [Fomitopsis schrenkii]